MRTQNGERSVINKEEGKKTYIIEHLNDYEQAIRNMDVKNTAGEG